jgi:hypothetical protein
MACAGCQKRKAAMLKFAKKGTTAVQRITARVQARLGTRHPRVTDATHGR